MKSFYVDILTVCYKLGLDLKKQSNNRYLCSCPLHKDDHPSFMLYVDTNSFYCYQCHVGGNVIVLATLFEPSIKTWQDLVLWISSDVQTRLPVKYSPPIWKIEELLHADRLIVLPTTELSTNSLFNGLGIRYAKDGRLRGRHIIPITLKGCLVAYEARDFNSFLVPKTLIQPSEVKIHSYLWNYDSLPEGLPIIVVEGIKGALAVISFGHSNVVSSFGARLSSDQVILLLSKRPIEVVISYDADIAGGLGTESAVSQLLAWTKVSRVYLPDGKDPWDIDEDTWSTCLRNRVLIDNQVRQEGFIARFREELSITSESGR